MQGKISNLCYENLDFLKTLACTKSSKKILDLLKIATTSQLLTLVEISLNIVKDRFKLTNSQKKRLLPYADIVRKMSRIRTERSVKKLVQKGGGISTLFPALITPILLEISQLLAKKINNE